MLKSPRDIIIVQIEKAFEDEIVTQSGIKFYKDTSNSPEWNVSCIGKVISSPASLSKRHDLRGLQNEVNDGDTIFFSYMAVFAGDLQNRDSFRHDNLFYHEGKIYWKVDYYHYLGKVVGDKIIPAQGYTFLEELKPETQERIGLIWVPDMVQKEKPKGKAKVIAVGKAKDGEPELSLNEGDIVRFNDRYACKYEVLGKKFIVFPNSYLLAKEAA